MDPPVDMVSGNTSTEVEVQNGGEKDSHITVDVVVENPKSTESAKPQTAEKKPAKRSKEEKRHKEEEKRIKLLLRAFDGLENTDAKVHAIAKKYVQLASDNKSVEHRKNELESRNEKLTKERDTLQSDYNKATLAKSKLESLCRELQRHSKLVKEECQLRAQEEEAKRKELSDRFQTTINDISQQMQDNFKRNEQLKIENEDLATKLKGLVSQYETREEHVDKVVQHKQLELQLAEAKMAQQSLQFNEIKEKSLLERQELLKDSLDYRKKYEIMAQQEHALKAQLAMYTERFDDFQSTLNKSNEVFATFKTEMDKMTKTIKKLEKENKTFKSRWENTNRSLLAMLEERSNMEKEIQTLTTRNSKLENLCRAMQKGLLVPNKENNSVENPESQESVPEVSENANDNLVSKNDVSAKAKKNVEEPNNDGEPKNEGKANEGEPNNRQPENEEEPNNDGEPKNEGKTNEGETNEGEPNNRQPENEEESDNGGEPHNEGQQNAEGETNNDGEPNIDTNSSLETKQGETNSKVDISNGKENSETTEAGQDSDIQEESSSNDTKRCEDAETSSSSNTDAS
ncbi:hypothetical protein QZH41_008786 [Actinostola sp. cb2023]|nr:hypothetical protein QZH41_008786 [Actinostola sp. cb2023]